MSGRGAELKKPRRKPLVFLPTEWNKLLAYLTQWLPTLEQEKQYTLNFERFYNPRSLLSNNYAWKLLDMLADALNSDKDSVYVEMLRRYGQTAEDKDGNKVVFSVRADIDISAWYEYYDEIGSGYVDGKPFKHYRGIKGSSQYSSKEMYHFIQGIISECDEMGIDSATPEERARLDVECDRWGA